ncbi:MAG: IucA/IucC family C-terminal-domain containing protein, partial [Myxococcota bacterium]
LEVTDEVRTLHITADIFDSFFRHLGALLHDDQIVLEHQFWALVAQCVRRYQADYPALNERFTRFDLLAPTYKRLCLNRLQLNNARQMLELNAPVDSFQYGTDLTNPLVPVSPRSVDEPRAPEPTL